MTNREDILLTDEFELLEAGEDFAEEDSTQTDAMIVMEIMKGEVRYAPWLGFGMRERIRGVNNLQKFKRELKIELENDGHLDPEVLGNNFDLSDLQIIV
jgi:hypothetical protein